MAYMTEDIPLAFLQGSLSKASIGGGVKKKDSLMTKDAIHLAFSAKHLSEISSAALRV